MVLRRSALSAVVLILLVATATAQTRRAPTIDDLIDLPRLEAPEISPDGTRVLYVRREIKEWKDNKRVSSIWMARTDGSAAFQFLAHERDRSPLWSPDGTRIAFLGARAARSEGGDEPTAQIYVIRADGGEAAALTSHKGDIRQFRWSADSSRLFFISADPKTDEEKAAEKAGDDAIVVDEGPHGQERGRWTGLWEIALADRTERRITQDRLLLRDLAPSPDGTRVAVVYRRENTRNGEYLAEVGLVDVATGALRDLTTNEAPERNVGFSPDGAWVSYLAPDARTWELAEAKIWTVPVGGGEPRHVSHPIATAIDDYFWLDPSTLVASGGERGRRVSWRLAADGSRADRLAPDAAGLSVASLARNGRHAAATTASPTEPNGIAVVDLTTGQVAPLAHANLPAPAFELAQWRVVSWKSTDGLEVDGLLWLPAGHTPGTRLPLLVSIHGGPAGVWWQAFRGINHLYASLGWAVLEPNVRGSTTYGDAFLRGNVRDIGGGDYHDVMTGVDALVAQGLADPDRLAVRGWSYGGILGGWTITQTARFKAASLGAMVADWPSEYAMGFNYDVVRWYIGGTPWDNPEGYRQKSAYTHIARVTTPTLLLHGEADTTCTIGQSMMFYQGLKDRDVTTRFIRFPREPHGFREPHHERIRDTEEIAWLMRHTLGVEWTAPERPGATKEEPKPTTAAAVQ